MAISMTRDALKRVQRALPQLRQCQANLVLPPTGHILRGFSFERTPYKETFYLWRIVLPLYRYHFRKTLDYSKRMPGGVRVLLSREAPDQTARDIVKIISEDIPNLERIRTPLDFLDHVSWMIGNDRPNFLLDLAVTYFLVGRLEDAMVSLRQVEARTEQLIANYSAESGLKDPMVERLIEIRSVADDLRKQMMADPAATARRISDWERNNIAAFDLGETLADTV